MAVAAPRAKGRGYRDGLNDEQRLKTVLTERGWTVRRVEHGGDVAYPLRGWHQRHRLPALQGWCPDPGRLVWLYPEWKSTCGLVRVMNNLQTTGIDRARFAALDAVEQLTGHPVVLCFLQKAQDAVVTTDLRANLVPAVGRGKALVFYGFPWLRRLCSYAEFMDAAIPDPAIETPLFSPPPDGHEQLDLWGRVF